MLPISAGFIFPNAEKLDTGTKGHRKEAFRYIVRNNLLELYDKYCQTRGDGEDDFLIEVLGAVKICHYFGKDYIYIPKLHGDYIESIKVLYEAHGYIAKEFDPIFIEDFGIEIPENELDDIYEGISDISLVSYNQTLVRGNDGEYTYNPKRDGD